MHNIIVDKDEIRCFNDISAEFECVVNRMKKCEDVIKKHLTKWIYLKNVRIIPE